MCMQYIPIKTRVVTPPKDNLFAVLDESLTALKEGDILLVTSKIVAIHQGLCVPITGTNKKELVKKESEYWIESHPKYAASPLAIKYHVMLYAAGIDESNSDGYYTLLPEHPYESAREIWQYLTQKHQLSKLGVIITDSHVQPLRWGCVGISIGFWGFHPIERHQGKMDLFGREMQLSSTNIVDGVSAGAGVVSGETNECTPLIIARDVPKVRFTDTDTRDELLVPPEDDLYYPVTKVFFE